MACGRFWKTLITPITEFVWLSIILMSVPPVLAT